MRRHPAFVVYRKEIRDALRDWRTIFLMVIMPFVLYPVISVVATEWAFRHETQRRARPSNVVVAGAPEDGARLLDELTGKKFVVTKRPGPVDQSLPKKILGDADAVVEIPAGLDRALAAGEAVKVPVFYDQTSDSSRTAHERLEEVIDALAERELERRLSDRGIARAVIEPISVASMNIATREKIGRAEVGKGLPMVIVMMIFMGAFYPAIDQTAGEKERGTLEALLTTPAKRHSLVLGKYLAVATLAFITGILNVLCLAASLLWMVRQAVRQSGEELSMGSIAAAVPWDAVALGLFAVAVTAALAGGLMIVVASLARNFKEAQTFLAPVQIVTTVPAMAAFLPGTSLTYATALIPISNVTLLLKDAISGTLHAGPAILTLVVTALLGAVTLSMAARLFDSERILFAAEGPRGPRSLRELIKVIRRPRDAGLSTAVVPDLPGQDSPLGAGEALGIFGVTAALWFFLGPEAQAFGVPGFILGQVFILVVPAVVYAVVKQADVRATLGLRRPEPGTLAGAILVGASAWVVSWGIGAFQEAIAPVPREQAEAMRQALEAMARTPVTLLVTVALVPAICEEILCRGMLARALRPAGIVFAAAMAAVAFAALHGSMYRFFPQLVLGLSLGLITLRARSVIPAIVIHLMHNGILLVMSMTGYVIDPPIAFPAAGALYVVGHYIALRKPSP